MFNGSKSSVRSAAERLALAERMERMQRERRGAASSATLTELLEARAAFEAAAMANHSADVEAIEARVEQLLAEAGVDVTDAGGVEVTVAR